MYTKSPCFDWNRVVTKGFKSWHFWPAPFCFLLKNYFHSFISISGMWKWEVFNITKVSYKMENPKRRKTCKLIYKNPKLPALSIESLPNEIFINIFSNLNIKDLLKCGQVNKKFRHISHDKSFWKCVNLYNQNVSCELIGHILRCEIYDFCLLSFCQNERT